MRLGPRSVSLFKEGRVLVAGTWLLSCLFIALIWGATIFLIVEEKRDALERSVSESASFAAIIAANLGELLGRGDLYAGMSRRLLEHAPHDANPARLPLIGDTAYLRHSVFKIDGTLVGASSARSVDPVLQDLAQLLFATATAEKGGPASRIGVPADPEHGGYWGIPLALPVLDDRKRILGAFAAYLDLGYLLRLYREVSLGTASIIQIRHADGWGLAELRDGMLVSGRGTALPISLTARSKDMAGQVQILRGRDGRDPVGVYRQLEKYPITVVVMREWEAVMGGLRPRHADYLLRAVVASLGLVALGYGLTRLARRQNRLYQELRHSERRNKELIEQLEGEKARAVELASHDFLTGLPNRMMFCELAAAELSRARRRRKLVALYFLDLDKFKHINDTLGHAVGDLLLKAVAERLRASLREYDLIARLGGDEFVVLASGLESARRAAAIAQKLVEALSAPYPDMDGHVVESSPSIGISLYPGDGTDIDTLLSRADLAMYHAKRSGRGIYRFYDSELNTAAARKLELISQLRPAIRAEEFRLHYQMRIHLDDLRPVGLEALMRWEHPGYGFIPPGEFIPLAEEHDVIQALGCWAIDTACAQLAAWRESGVPLLPVAINISPLQLRDDRLIEVISAALGRHDIPPSLLQIEVTESSFMERPEVAQRVLESLHQCGIKISLDDYGTGFSGLSRLKQLAISVVKIDRSFIRDLRNDTGDAMIVASTISLSHSLGLQVVAEGVETKEQAVHLKAAGCDEVQGFYFHRPADAADVAAELRKRLMQRCPEAAA
ncbi:MAG: putative bifunctional diguanylate cyclase/phosphodiesterase [Noviherbaspirillum sp.]